MIYSFSIRVTEIFYSIQNKKVRPRYVQIKERLFNCVVDIPTLLSIVINVPFTYTHGCFEDIPHWYNCVVYTYKV